MNKYIIDVLNQKWKTIEESKAVESIDWDENTECFILKIEDEESLINYTYTEFFNNIVLKSNNNFWANEADHLITSKKYVGWLCVLNALSIFSKYDVDPSKETTVISAYVKERVDDTHYAVKNNLLPPWLEEKADSNIMR